MKRENEEKSVLNAAGAVLRQIGRRKKRMLKKYLDEKLDGIPRAVLKAGIARLTKSDQEYYLQLHAEVTLPKTIGTKASLVDFESLRESFFKDR